MIICDHHNQSDHIHLLPIYGARQSTKVPAEPGAISEGMASSYHHGQLRWQMDQCIFWIFKSHVFPVNL